MPVAELMTNHRWESSISWQLVEERQVSSEDILEGCQIWYLDNVPKVLRLCVKTPPLSH